MEKQFYPQQYLYRRILQAKLFMDNHYHQAINLDSIAVEACFSKFHFIRLFKTVYDKTPYQYLIAVRIEKAKTYLLTEVSIAEVCFSVGFDSVSSFAGLFKKMTAITPALYQQQQWARKIEIGKMPLKFVPNCFAEHHGWAEKQF